MASAARWALVAPLCVVPFHRGVVVRVGATPMGMLTVPEIVLYAAMVLVLVARLGGGSGAPCIPAGPRTAWTVFLGSATVSFAVHPTGFGLVAMVRLVVLGLVVGEVARLAGDAEWTRITLPLSAAMAVQATLAIAQRVHGGPLGLASIGERRSGFKPFGATLLPAGTTVHTNTLGLYGVAIAALLLAAAADRSGRGEAAGRAVERIEAAGLVACAVCIGVTGSRTTAIAVCLLVLAALVTVRSRRGPGLLRGVTVFAASTATTVVASASVWLGRAQQSSGASIETLGSGRMALVRQALAVFRLSPVTGVGPGNYLLHVLTDPAIIRYSAEGAPVHNLWLSVLATYGLVGIAAFGVVTVLLLRLGRRAGSVGALVGLPALVTLGLDVATTLSPGFLLLGVSIGVIGGVAGRPAEVAGRPPAASTSGMLVRDASIDGQLVGSTSG